MQARTLAYRLMVLSPILYIGSLAVRARMHLDVFDFMACTTKQHEAITDYRPFVIQAAPFRSQSPKHLSRPYLRRVAMNWVEASHRGELRPLLPVHIHDFVREGVKQEIYRSADVMVMHLMAVARYEAQEGNAGQSAQDLVLAIRLSEVMKYSDPYAVAHSGLQQRSALTHLSEIQPKMSSKSVIESRAALVAIREKQEPLDHLVRWMKQLYNSERVRNGHPVLPIEEVDHYFSFDRNSPEDGLVAFTSVPRPVWASAGEVPTMLGELRMAGSSQTGFLRKLDEQIEALVLKDPEHSSFAWVAP